MQIGLNLTWLKPCQSIQLSPDTGNARGMYDGIKKSVGPGVKKTSPLKSLTGEILTDRNKQIERWTEHYAELYSRETVVTATALDSVGGSKSRGSSTANQLWASSTGPLTL